MKNIIQNRVLALSLLNILGSSHMVSARELREAIAKELNLDSKALSQAPDLQQITFNNQFNNQIDLVLLFLFNSGLIECPYEATYTLSEAGNSCLRNLLPIRNCTIKCQQKSSVCRLKILKNSYLVCVN